MALINPPAWLQQGSYPAKTDRQVIESIVPSEGVASGFLVTQTPTASMDVNITAGKAFIAGTSVSLQGMYNVINDATVAVKIPGSNISNPRYDLIVVTVNDADVSGSNNSVVLSVLSGAPSSSPIVPSIPASTLVLARIYVGAGVSTIGSGVITDYRIKTAAKGGVITVADTAARLRLSAPSSGDNLFVSEISTGMLWKLQGTSWSPVSGETFIATSTTRPSGVPAGFRVWETDTKQSRVWNGTAWVWDGGDKPSAYFVAAIDTANLSTVAANGTGIVMNADTIRGGVTSSAAGGFNFVKVKDAGVYRVTVNAKYSFSTGVASGAGAIVMALGRYTNTNAYVGRTDLTQSYPPGTTNWLQGTVSSTMLVSLTAGQSVLPVFYRIGGASDWTVLGGSWTSIVVEWVGP